MSNELLVQTGKIARVTFNNPEKLNTFTVERLKEFNAILKELEGSEKTKVILIDAVGEKAFSAGLDTTMLTGGDASIKDAIVKEGSTLSESVFYLSKPVVCAITAPAVGWGCILSMLADFRFASPNVYFKLPELEIGIYPATGALSLCMMHFGMSLGSEMLFLGAKLGAERAASIGFVNGIAPTGEEVAAMAKATAKQLSRLNQQVVMYSKTNARLLQGIEYGQALALEARCFKEMMQDGKGKDWHAMYLENLSRLRSEFGKWILPL